MLRFTLIKRAMRHGWKWRVIEGDDWLVLPGKRARRLLIVRTWLAAR